MSVQLGWVKLPDNTIWVDRETYIPIATATDVTLGGKILVTEEQLRVRPITLSITPVTGYITKETFEELKEMAKATGVTYRLLYRGEEYTVRFKNEDPPAVDMHGVVPDLEELSDVRNKYYVGTIKLMTV